MIKIIIGGLIWAAAFTWAIMLFGWYVWPWLFTLFVMGWALTFATVGIIILCAVFLIALVVMLEYSGL